MLTIFASVAMVSSAWALPTPSGERALAFPAVWRADSSWLTYVALACPSKGDCTAFGGFHAPSGSGEDPAVETATGGAWATPSTFPLPGGAVMNEGYASIACSSVVACVAVGDSYSPAGEIQPLIAQPSAGSWTATNRVPVPAGATQAFLDAVWCDQLGCIAVGGYDVGSSQSVGGFVVSEQGGGAWDLDSVLPLPSGTSNTYELIPSGISCTNLSSCSVVGSLEVGNSNVLLGYAALRSKGEWGPAATLDPGKSTFVNVTSISCWTASSCLAVGSVALGASERLFPLAASWMKGRWSAPTRLANNFASPRTMGGTLRGVSCTKNATCEVVGTLQRRGTVATAIDNGNVPVAYTWSRREWSPPSLVIPPWTGASRGMALTAVSCPSGSWCEAIGNYTSQKGVTRSFASVLDPFGAPARPSAPRHLRLTGPDRDRFRLTWSAPLVSGGTPIRSYRVLITGTRATETHLVCSTTSSGCFFAIPASWRGTVGVAAVNASGRVGAMARRTVIR